MQRFAILVCLFFTVSFLQAQDTWDLQRCVDYARERNLSLQRNEIAVQNAEITTKVNRLQQLPSVNGTLSGGLQFGRTIDPTTDAFGTSSLGYGSLGVSAGLPLYTGGRIKNTIEQGKVNLDLAKADAATAANDIGLNIAVTYLSILLAEEEASNAQTRLELSKEQLDRTNKLITAGSLPENDRLDILAQIARDKQNVILTENNVTLNYLNLKQFLELEDNPDFQIQKPEVVLPTDDIDKYDLNTLYTQALQSQPQIEASELRVKSSDYDIEIAKAGKRPSVNVFGSMSSNYSTLARAFEEAQFQTVLQESTVIINDMPATIGVFGLEQVGEIPKKNFGNQFTENFGQSLGLSVSIPIYNNGRNDANIERAELGVLDAQLQAKQVKQQLRRDVQQYLANARASKLALEASEQAYTSSKAAFKNTEKRFEYGAANNLQYTTARNTRDQAETDLLRAKYQYVFDCKVLDFYIGKPLRLN